MRLLSLHPKIIDLSLDRMHRLLSKLGHPEAKCPPVIHIAGTNGKGSTQAFLRAMMGSAGLKVHAYTSPHLVRFHERIRVAGDLISEPDLSRLLEECEAANGTEPITFFEITTAAAFLAFSRTPADYLLLEVGLGGRLDATNVIENPVACCITSIGLDHQSYLGDTLELIAREKAGIIKPQVCCVVGFMPQEARDSIEAIALKLRAPLTIAGQEWDVFEQQGRLVFQDQDGLLDLPLPALAGQHQLENAGNAIAVLRKLNDPRISEIAIADGLKSVHWPARFQQLRNGGLSSSLNSGSELWLDGGHNADAGIVLARSLAKLRRRPLVIIWGMLNTKDAGEFMKPLAKLASLVVTLRIPDEANAVDAEILADVVRGFGVAAQTAVNLTEAISKANAFADSARILICGSLYLAGHVLAAEEHQTMSTISGATKR